MALLSPAYVPEAKCDISDEICLRGTRILPSQTPLQLFSLMVSKCIPGLCPFPFQSLWEYKGMGGRVAAGAAAKDKGRASDVWLSGLPLQVLVPPALQFLVLKEQPCRGSNHGAA